MQQAPSWLADFASDCVVYTYKIVGFLFYASGHVLLVATVLSFLYNSEIIMQTVVEGSFLAGTVYAIITIGGVGIISGLLAAVVHTTCKHVLVLVRTVDTLWLYMLRVETQYYLLLDTIAGRFDVWPILRERWYAPDLHVLHLHHVMVWRPYNDNVALETAPRTLE